MKKQSTADEIEEMNRAALRRLASFNAEVGEHVIKPMAKKLIAEVEKISACKGK